VSSVLKAALAYHKRGLSVISILPHDKKPAREWKVYQNRPATEDEIEEWFSACDANVGVVTGAVSGLVVIDLDTAEAKEKLKQLSPSLNFSAVPRSRTGKGWQLFFQHPRVITPNRAGIIAGLDLRGDGGYVVAPPSIHPNGKQYRWEVPINGELPELPPELLTLISSPNGSESGYRERFNTAQALAGVSQGQRDETLFKLACKLRGADVPQEIAENLVIEAARNCQPPFDENVALEKVRRSYGRYEPKSEAKKALASGHGFKLVSATELLASTEPDTHWLWEGALPEAGMSLVVGKPKAGKSTFAFAMSLAVASGRDFLNRATTAGTVVYLALEEKRAEVKKKLEAAGGQVENILFHFGAAPAEAVAGVGELVKETRARLLVIDVLQKFLRVRDLNDYALVTNALEPLLTVARESGCHVLLTHHAGKADRPEGDDVLGSTALLGGVDTLVSIKKREGRRTFFTIQRYGENLPETVIELTNTGGLEAIGSRQDVDVADAMPAILEVLGDGELARDEILDRAERKRSVVLRALAKLCDEKKIERSGTGKKGDPFAYKKIPVFPFPDTLGNGGTEMKTASNPANQKTLFRSRDFSKMDSVPETRTDPFLNEKEGLDPWD
jgi:hypothetical protein